MRETWATGRANDAEIDSRDRNGRKVRAEGGIRAGGRESGAELEQQAWWVKK